MGIGLGIGWKVASSGSIAPRVIRPTHGGTSPSSVPVVITSATAWKALQVQNARVWQHQWVVIRRHLLGLHAASQGIISPSLAGWPPTTPDPHVTALGLPSTMHQWDAAIVHIPVTVAPRLPVSVWNAAWNTAVKDLAIALGPDPGAIISQTGPGEASHFTAWVDHRYAVWAARIPHHIWVTQLDIGLGTIHPAGRPAVRWGVFRPPSTLSTSTIHVITLTRVPFVANVILQARHHGDTTTVRSGWIVLGLVRTPHQWHWILEGLHLNPGSSLPSTPLS